MTKHVLPLIIIGLAITAVSAPAIAGETNPFSTLLDSQCSGPHCTLTGTILAHVNHIEDIRGVFIHFAMSTDTLLVESGMRNNTGRTAQPFPPGTPVTIPIDASGEIVGHAWNFYDSPPVVFDRAHHFTAITAGLQYCGRVTIREVQNHGIPATCGNVGTLGSESNLDGTFTDSVKVFTATSAGQYTQPTATVRCESNNHKTITCHADAGFAGTVLVQLKRQLTSLGAPRGQIVNSFNGTSILGTMVSTALVTFGQAQPECSDRTDNDSDIFVDADDPGCHEGDNPANPYIPSDNSELHPLSVAIRAPNTAVRGTTVPVAGIPPYLSTSAFQNQTNPLDVDHNGGFGLADVQAIVTTLQNIASGGTANPPTPPPSADVDGNGQITPLDVAHASQPIVGDWHYTWQVDLVRNGQRQPVTLTDIQQQSTSFVPTVATPAANDYYLTTLTVIDGRQRSATAEARIEVTDQPTPTPSISPSPTITIDPSPTVSASPPPSPTASPTPTPSTTPQPSFNPGNIRETD